MKVHRDVAADEGGIDGERRVEVAVGAEAADYDMHVVVEMVCTRGPMHYLRFIRFGSSE